MLVTGAGGFLGGVVCRDLMEQGFCVRAMVHTPPTSGTLAAHIVPCDLSDAQSLRAAVKGASAIVHLAARVHIRRDRSRNPLDEFRRVNVEGTRTLLNAATAEGIRRFVFVSSVKAVGESSDRPFTYLTRPAPTDPYGMSKLEAELLVQEVVSPTAMRTSILRLPLVYGPRMKGNMRLLFDLVRYRIPIPIFEEHRRRSIVYSGNVAAAVRYELQRSGPGTYPLFVSDPRALSVSELVQLIGAALGKQTRLFKVPSTVLRVLERLVEQTGTKSYWALALERLSRSLEVDGTEFSRATGGTLPYDTKEGLEMTASWYLTAVAKR